MCKCERNVRVSACVDRYRIAGGAMRSAAPTPASNFPAVRRCAGTGRWRA